MKRTFFQLVRFGVVGCGNTLIDALVYMTLTRTMGFFAVHYLLASTGAFIISGINSFMWNKHWTFKDGISYSYAQLVRFFVVIGITYGFNQLFLWSFVSFGVYDILAKVCAGVLAGGFNFTLQKVWAFPIVKGEENQYTKTEQ